MRATFLSYYRPSIEADDERAVLEVLRSGWITTGPRTKAFEKALAAYVGTARAVAVNSCTAALHLALEAAGVGPGDEVITSPITFASTANVIVHRGATPVFADVEPDTMNIDATCLDAAITPRTKAVIPVDFAGHPADLGAIMARAQHHRLVVIEDAAHAIGAEYRGRRVGSIADMTAFSFHATMNITSAEGGALTTNNHEWADRIGMMALHGISRDAWRRYGADSYKHWEIICAGYKYNMFDLQGALALSQLAKIERFWERRDALKARLDAGLADVPEVERLAKRPGIKHACHLYPLVLRTEMLEADRDAIMDAIEAENIGVGVHFRAAHLHPYYQETYGFRRGDFPRAEYYSDRTISLPLYPKMTEADADDVVAAVRKVIGRFRR